MYIVVRIHNFLIFHFFSFSSPKCLRYPSFSLMLISSLLLPRLWFRPPLLFYPCLSRTTFPRSPFPLSPGTMLLSAGFDQNILAWDVHGHTDSSPIFVLKGHTAAIVAMSSPYENRKRRTNNLSTVVDPSDGSSPTERHEQTETHTQYEDDPEGLSSRLFSVDTTGMIKVSTRGMCTCDI